MTTKQDPFIVYPHKNDLVLDRIINPLKKNSLSPDDYDIKAFLLDYCLSTSFDNGGTGYYLGIRMTNGNVRSLSGNTLFSILLNYSKTHTVTLRDLAIGETFELGKYSGTLILEAKSNTFKSHNGEDCIVIVTREKCNPTYPTTLTLEANRKVKVV